MPILLTAAQQIAYVDPTTPLRDLAEVSRLVAENLDAALNRGGYQPATGTPRGRIKTLIRTTAANFIANASGTGLQTPNSAEFPILEGTVAVAPGRQYELKLAAPQLGGVAGERASLSLYVDGQVINRIYTNLTPNGGPYTIPAPFTVTSAGTKPIKVTLCRDVGSGAFSMYADAVASRIVLTVDDLGVPQ